MNPQATPSRATPNCPAREHLRAPGLSFTCLANRQFLGAREVETMAEAPDAEAGNDECCR